MVESRMSKIEHVNVVDGPVVSEGGQRPSALSIGHRGKSDGASGVGPLVPGQRWSVSRKREVVLRLWRGESAELLSRELGVPSTNSRSGSEGRRRP